MIKNVFVAAALAFSGLSFQLNAQEINNQQIQAILQAKQGSVIQLVDFLKKETKSIDYDKIILPGPQFIISDDPEYIRVPEAIVLKEPVQPGAVRLYVYNVNAVKEPQKIDRKITAVIRNKGKAPMHLRMLKYSSQKPSTNYFQIGKQGLADYFASKGTEEIVTIQPGKVAAIDKQLEKNIVKFDELVHGFYEFVIDQPGEIAILQTSPSTDGPVAFNTIKTILPTSHKNAGRGLFGVSNYKIINKEIVDTKDGVAQFIVADGKNDPWIIGKESTSGQLSKLAGNYGVMYDIEMKWKSTDGKGLALVTWNSRSADNKWCSGMAASMVVSKGVFNEGIIQLPKDQLVTKGAPEAILIQIFKPEKGREEQTLKLTYSPPGASCLPTPLIFIPIDIK